MIGACGCEDCSSSSSMNITTATRVSTTARTYIALVTVDENEILKKGWVAGGIRCMHGSGFMLCYVI